MLGLGGATGTPTETRGDTGAPSPATWPKVKAEKLELLGALGWTGVNKAVWLSAMEWWHEGEWKVAEAEFPLGYLGPKFTQAQNWREMRALDWEG